jgi:hypothetical protein
LEAVDVERLVALPGVVVEGALEVIAAVCPCVLLASLAVPTSPLLAVIAALAAENV